jgi:hypothetical protein
MKQSHPFPRSIGFGVVGGNPKSSSSYLPYSLSAARLSSSTLARPSSRSQMLPPSQAYHVPKPPLAEIVYMTTTGIVSVNVDFEKIANVDERQVSMYNYSTTHLTDILQVWGLESDSLCYGASYPLRSCTRRACTEPQ